MTQEARNRATAKYRKENVISKTIRFYPAEAELWTRSSIDGDLIKLR